MGKFDGTLEKGLKISRGEVCANGSQMTVALAEEVSGDGKDCV